MDINSVATESKSAGSVVVPSPAGQVTGAVEQVKPVSSVANTDNGSMEDKSLQARQQGKEIINLEDAARYAEEIQGRLDKMGSNLQFSVDEKTESVVFKFTSKTDGEVIRQIPSEQILELRGKLDDLLGLIFDRRV